VEAEDSHRRRLVVGGGGAIRDCPESSHSNAVFVRFHARHNIEIPRLEFRVVPISNALRAKTSYTKITT